MVVNWIHEKVYGYGMSCANVLELRIKWSGVTAFAYIHKPHLYVFVEGAQNKNMYPCGGSTHL